MVARLPLLCDAWQADSNGVLVAAAAGIRQEIVSGLGILQRAVSRLALVYDNRCREVAYLVVFPLSQRALKGRNVSKRKARREET